MAQFFRRTKKCCVKVSVRSSSLFRRSRICLFARMRRILIAMPLFFSLFFVSVVPEALVRRLSIDRVLPSPSVFAEMLPSSLVRAASESDADATPHRAQSEASAESGV